MRPPRPLTHPPDPVDLERQTQILQDDDQNLLHRRGEWRAPALLSRCLPARCLCPLSLHTGPRRKAGALCARDPASRCCALIPAADWVRPNALCVDVVAQGYVGTSAPAISTRRASARWGPVCCAYDLPRVRECEVPSPPPLPPPLPDLPPSPPPPPPPQGLAQPSLPGGTKLQLSAWGILPCSRARFRLLLGPRPAQVGRPAPSWRTRARKTSKSPSWTSTRNG